MENTFLLKSHQDENTSNEEFNSESVKKLNRPLLIATTYFLNNSGTKKVYIGLEYNDSTEKYQPIILLKNTQYSRGVRIDIDTWSEIQNKIQHITDYFKPSTAALCIQRQERIKLSKIDIVLATSYGSKSVMFVQRDGNDFNSENPYYIQKKKKVLIPSITMQKRTFEGLKNIAVCIEERYRRLQRVLSDVNECKNLLRDELCDTLTLYDFHNDNSYETVKNIIYEKRNDLKNNILKKLASKNSCFLEFYFEILFTEMTIIHYDVFHDEIYNIFGNYDAQKI